MKSAVVLMMGLAGPGAIPGLDADEPAPAITFSDHIAPLLQQHCVSCHSPQGIGPFSLLTYQDVRSRSRQIEEVTGSGFMPPWQPARGHGPALTGVRGLDEEEIQVIRAWRQSFAIPPGPR